MPSSTVPVVYRTPLPRPLKRLPAPLACSYDCADLAIIDLSRVSAPEERLGSVWRRTERMFSIMDLPLSGVPEEKGLYTADLKAQMTCGLEAPQHECGKRRRCDGVAATIDRVVQPSPEQRVLTPFCIFYFAIVDEDAKVLPYIESAVFTTRGDMQAFRGSGRGDDGHMAKDMPGGCHG
ncbi:hypothetical protein WOLCODRAFT_165958 [Wolfiporia cocos MD-104 SS10]|uniref:Uncharacterized protein n=1 Tax=Wolfiporia cocos (strain MD-104) TaxID=742152 RepID=A0A2H3IZZ1_WOLCO|nr:hypothetical protein WOLCODRAFT_165958 [Wolfiporia cocos MD-104 SS10]